MVHDFTRKFSFALIARKKHCLTRLPITGRHDSFSVGFCAGDITTFSCEIPIGSSRISSSNAHEISTFFSFSSLFSCLIEIESQ
jgi:hypothetical protein